MNCQPVCCKWLIFIIFSLLSVEEDDFLVHGFPTDWALCDLIGTELAGAMTAQEHAVLASVHAHLTLSLKEQDQIEQS